MKRLIIESLIFFTIILGLGGLSAQEFPSTRYQTFYDGTGYTYIIDNETGDIRVFLRGREVKFLPNRTYCDNKIKAVTGAYGRAMGISEAYWQKLLATLEAKGLKDKDISNIVLERDKKISEMLKELQ